MTGYTKLFGEIVLSSIWAEDKETKILWITMLALRDRNHQVKSSVLGLARLAGLTVEETEAGLKKLLSPDEYSRSKEFEGRRIEAVDGGWFILNGEKYRQKMGADELRAYNTRKKREYRQRDKNLMEEEGQELSIRCPRNPDSQSQSQSQSQRQSKNQDNQSEPTWTKTDPHEENSQKLLEDFLALPSPKGRAITRANAIKLILSCADIQAARKGIAEAQSKRNPQAYAATCIRALPVKPQSEAPETLPELPKRQPRPKNTLPPPPTPGIS